MAASPPDRCIATGRCRVAAMIAAALVHGRWRGDIACLATAGGGRCPVSGHERWLMPGART